MQVDIGFQSNHSENMVLIAKFQTPAQAENAFFLLGRALYAVKKNREAAEKIRRKLGVRRAKAYKAEIIEKEIEQFGQKMDPDWDPLEASIGQDHDSVQFCVYTGNDIEMICHFLENCEGNLSVQDLDETPMCSPEYIATELLNERLKINDKH